MDIGKEIEKQVKRYNDKLKREANKNPGLSDFLPDRLSAKDLKSKVKTPKDLRLLENKVNRLFGEGALKPVQTKQGVKTTAYELREIKLAVERINRQRQKELKQAAPSTQKGTMGSIRQNSLQPKDFNPDNIRKSDWDKFVESAEKQSWDSYTKDKMIKYKENYLKSVKENLGRQGKELYDYVSKLTPEQLYESFYDDPILQIGFTSDPLPAASIAKAALAGWKEKYGG